MRIRVSAVQRGAICLMPGYLVFFLLLHLPVARWRTPESPL